MSNKIKIFSLYSGIFYEVGQEEYELLDDGQIPLLDNFKPCKKCWERGYTGFSLTNYMYIPCKCVNGKFLDIDKINKKFNLAKDV